MGDAIKGLLNNRRALQIAIDSFSSLLPYNRSHLLPTTRTILAALAEDRLTLSLRIELIIQGLPWEETAPELMKLTDELHAGALARALDALQQASTRPDARLFELETTFAASEDERLRRLALAALVAQSMQAKGWSDEAIARLQTYREDSSPLVAEAAQFTFIM